MRRTGGGWIFLITVLIGWAVFYQGIVQAQTIWWDTGMVKLRQDNDTFNNGDPIPSPGDSRICGTQANFGCNGEGVIISAARNEFEPFQIFVADTASSVDVTISDLIGPSYTIQANKSDGSPNNIVIYREHYLNVTTRSSNSPDSKLGKWPDALIPKKDEYFGQVRNMPSTGVPAFPFNVISNQKQGIWVDVYVPKESSPGVKTPAGLYKGTVTVTRNGATTLAIVPIKLMVRDFELPSTPTLKTAYSFGLTPALIGHYGPNATISNQGDPATWELLCLYTKEMLLHRISNSSVIWPAPQWVSGSPSHINWTLATITKTCNQRYPEFLNGRDDALLPADPTKILPNGKLPGAKITRAKLTERTPAEMPTPKSLYYQDYATHFAGQTQYGDPNYGWKFQLFYYLWDEPHWDVSGMSRVCNSSNWPALFQKAKTDFKDPNVDIPLLVTTSKDAASTCFSLANIPGPYTKYIDFWLPGNLLIHNRPEGFFPYNQNNRAEYNIDLGIASDPIVPLSPIKKELGWYQACGNHICSGQPEGDGSSNGLATIMADMPPAYNRMFEWLTYEYQVGQSAPGPGSELYYETVYAYAPDPLRATPACPVGNDPWTNIYCFTGNGDGTLFYPGRPDKIGPSVAGKHIPISTIRLKMIREGIEDYEYLKMVETKKGQGWVQSNVMIPYLQDQDPIDQNCKLITYVWYRLDQFTGTTDPCNANSPKGILAARYRLAQELDSYAWLPAVFQFLN